MIPTREKADHNPETGISHYHREIVSFGKAAELSHLSQFQIGHELAGRGIAKHYAEEDIAEDLAYSHQLPTLASHRTTPILSS